jgi:hypothetical protein
VQQRHWSAFEEFVQVDQGKDNHGRADLCEIDGDAQLAATQDAGSRIGAMDLAGKPIPGHKSSAGRSLRVGLDVLHNDDGLAVRTLRDGIPDSQAVRRKVEAVSTW